MRPVTVLVPGLVACLLGLVLGSGPAWVTAAALCFGVGALWPRGALLLVLAPLLLAAAAPLDSLLAWSALSWWTVAALATAPLLLRLGGRLPWIGLVVAALAPLPILALALHPWAPTLFASDVATRSQVALLALATLLVLAATRAWAQRSRSPPW